MHSLLIWLWGIANVALWVGPSAAGLTGAEGPNGPRRAELVYLLRQDCGSCHGMQLKGGLGPALTPGALAGKPATYLEQTILAGRPGTPMPPWAGLLTEAEVRWLVSALLQGITDGR
jgi:cytochrome c55X